MINRRDKEERERGVKKDEKKKKSVARDRQSVKATCKKKKEKDIIQRNAKTKESERQKERMRNQMNSRRGVGVTHHTFIGFFLRLLLPTGNLEVQSSRTGKREDERRGRGGGRGGAGTKRKISH